MTKRTLIFRHWTWVFLALVGIQLGTNLKTFAQDSIQYPTDDFGPRRKKHIVPEPLPKAPSLQPAFSVPVGPLGFSAPGPAYLGRLNSLVSLDFLDENRLLFSFRAPGLLRRETGDEKADLEREIRATVLSLPQGKVESETVWTVPDRARYLWMLKDGHFLLRDRNGLERGDATLQLSPLLGFPGPILSMEMDPAQEILITYSPEPASTPEASGNLNHSHAHDGNDAAPAPASGLEPDFLEQIVQWQLGQVQHTSRVHSIAPSPITSEGHLECKHLKADQWLLKLNLFAGGSREIGRIASSCSPNVDLVSDRELVLTTCTQVGEWKLAGMSISGRSLWEEKTAAVAIWPLLLTASNGSRLARETIVLNRPVDKHSHARFVDVVKGQLVRVYDAADGKIVMEAPVDPVLDAGGNMAFSPSGRRLALLNDGAIQVFELPAAGPVQ